MLAPAECGPVPFGETGEPSDGRSPADPWDQVRSEFTDGSQRLHSDVGIVYLELLTRSQCDAAVAALLRDIDATCGGMAADHS
jgi:hypothetical protein